jgi:hypothetical protein
MKSHIDHHASMIDRHVKTWFVWLEKLTVMGKEKFTDAERFAMAEALSYASPEGPNGVVCEDGCEKHPDGQAKRVTLLLAELLEQGLTIKDGDYDKALHDLRRSMTEDERLIRPRLTIRDLAEIRTVISQKSSDVAYARKMYPRTWAIIEKLIH